MLRGFAFKIENIDETLTRAAYVWPPDSESSKDPRFVGGYIFPDGTNTTTPNAKLREQHFLALSSRTFISNIDTLARGARLVWTTIPRWDALKLLWQSRKDIGALPFWLMYDVGCRNPLFCRFYSIGAFQMGPSSGTNCAVKYKYVPCSTGEMLERQKKKFNVWHFRHQIARNMEAILKNDVGCYHMYVQPQRCAKSKQSPNQLFGDDNVDSAEDISRDWHGAWYRVATLHFQRGSQLAGDHPRCESGLFNPFFSAEVHQPLGVTAEVRRWGYAISQSRRHLSNLQMESETHAGRWPYDTFPAGTAQYKPGLSKVGENYQKSHSISTPFEYDNPAQKK